jgi:hypothetical protein
MFTLFQLKDVKWRLKRIEGILNSCYENTGAVIVQTDVTKMYTNLCHEHIIKDVIWLIERVQHFYLKGKRKIRNDCKYITISRCKDEKTGKYRIHWSNCTGTEQEYTLTVDLLVMVVCIDLKYCYQRQADKIIKQKNGCPIGGFLSPIYANIKCARDEFDFMKSLGKEKRRVCGIRQVDDLFLCIAYDKKGRKNSSKNKAESWAKHITSKEGVYKGGLVLEEQEFETLEPNVTRHKFAGTVITVNQNGVGIKFECKPLNKNESSLLDKGIQTYPKYISSDSLVPPHYKKGIQITTYIRLKDQSSNWRELVRAMLVNALEMYSLGFDTNFLFGALKHLALKQKSWKKLAILFLENLKGNDMILGNKKLLERTKNFLEKEKIFPCS